jgi:hypothetical protein
MVPCAFCALRACLCVSVRVSLRVCACVFAWLCVCAVLLVRVLLVRVLLVRVLLVCEFCYHIPLLTYYYHDESANF